jgi:hypothetical protein
MFCSSCGREVRPGASFCEGCGKGVEPDGLPGAEGGFAGAPPFPSEADVVCFVGEKSGYYLRKFRKFQAGRTEAFAPTWNWSAFCFTTGWFLYRKMYLWTLASFVASCIPGVGFAAWIAAGVAGNYAYFRHVSARISEARRVTPEAELPAVLSRWGGVHVWVIWVGAVFAALAVLAVLGIIAAIVVPRFLELPAGTRLI